MLPLLDPKRTHTRAESPADAPNAPRWYFVNGHAVYGVPSAADGPRPVSRRDLRAMDRSRPLLAILSGLLLAVTLWGTR